MDAARFAMFIATRDLSRGPPARDRSRRGTRRRQPASRVDRIHSLRLHYARTLDAWADALESRKDEAVAMQSAEVYDRYMKYLTGCAKMFREGYIDINQFTLAK